MKRNAPLVFALWLTLAFAACSTKVSYNPVAGAPTLDPEATFSVGEIVDETGYTFPADEPETMDLSEGMATALKKALRTKGLLARELTAQELPGQGLPAEEGPAEEVSAEEVPAEAIPAEKRWVINVTLLDYAPGNAFHRWLMPGLGATKLSVVAEVAYAQGPALAEIPVERSIGFGGAYTVGAWRYVFDEVAVAIVDALATRK